MLSSKIIQLHKPTHALLPEASSDTLTTTIITTFDNIASIKSFIGQSKQKPYRRHLQRDKVHISVKEFNSQLKHFKYYWKTWEWLKLLSLKHYFWRWNEQSFHAKIDNHQTLTLTDLDLVLNSPSALHIPLSQFFPTTTKIITNNYHLKV